MRTRLRTLHAAGRAFVWRAEIRHVQGEAGCHRCIRVRIWGAGRTSCAAQADLLSKSWPAPWGACATDSAYPTPSDVRAIIERALAAGWDPGIIGGTFQLTEATGWELPAFLLTDRLNDPTAADPSRRVIDAHRRKALEQDS
ncbi:hypothetical protein Rhe02_35640 [Rhizocola hellebori]|uniref:Uncharacterized protein n=1 Tax=Rhizocola hellebori TaxID=1392758 RepID=A0A8J3Q963_9ACTN|nr:hypothetical protein Rhe02_35640 [Rhizocola hellebori]